MRDAEIRDAESTIYTLFPRDWPPVIARQQKRAREWAARKDGRRHGIWQLEISRRPYARSSHRFRFYQEGVVHGYGAHGFSQHFLEKADSRAFSTARAPS